MMDSIKSFKGYDKVDLLEEQAFRRKTRRRFTILVVSTFVLVAVIIGAVTGTVIHKRNSKDSGEVPSTQTSPTASLKAVCSSTQHLDSCFTSISELESSNTTDPEGLFKLSLHVMKNSLTQLVLLPDKLIKSTNDEVTKKA